MAVVAAVVAAAAEATRGTSAQADTYLRQNGVIVRINWRSSRLLESGVATMNPVKG